jgi:aconitate hydratase
VSANDSFDARSTLEAGGESYEIYRLDALQERYDVARLPYSLKILLENLLRNGEHEGAEAIASWDAKADPSKEIAYTPARVLMQDFTGVPAIVDLAAMRDAMEELGGDATKINPLVPVELVIDHSIQVDVFAERLAFQRNAELEFERNRERYAFLRWGQTSCTSRGWWWRATARPTRTRWWGPTPTPRWSTASVCWAGAWAESRRRPRCSASRCRC